MHSSYCPKYSFLLCPKIYFAVQVKEVYQEKIAMTVEAMPVRVRVKKKVIMKRRAKLLQDHQVHRGLGGAINTKIE